MKISYNIKIDTNNQTGIFNPIQTHKYNSFLYDFRTNSKIIDDADNNEYEILAVSPDLKYVALVTKEYVKYTNKRFIVQETATGNIVYKTEKHLVYDAIFSPKSDYVFTRAYKNNGFCVEIGKDVVIDKFPFSIDPESTIYQNNSCVYPIERKSKLIQLSFDTLSFSEIIIPDTKECIQQLRADSDDNLYLIDKKFVVRKYDKELNLLWTVKYAKDEHNFCNYAPHFFVKESVNLLIYYCPDNNGCYMAQNLSTGEKLTIQRKGEWYGAGLIKSVFFDNKVMDSFGQTFDVITGETELIKGIF